MKVRLALAIGTKAPNNGLRGRRMKSVSLVCFASLSKNEAKDRSCLHEVMRGPQGGYA